MNYRFDDAKPPKARSGQNRRLAKVIVRDYATAAEGERHFGSFGNKVKRSKNHKA